VLLRQVICPVLLAFFAASASGTFAFAQSTEVLIGQRAQYDAVRSKSILELQPFRSQSSAVLPVSGTPVRLTSVNPTINAWFLLEVGSEGSRQSYHIENPDPTGQTVELVAGAAPALSVNGQKCAPWQGDPSELVTASGSGVPYAPLCQDRLYLRNQVPGTRTTLERTTEFLRDNVWNGEEVVRFVRDKFFKDSNFESAEVVGAAGSQAVNAGPVPARTEGGSVSRPVISALHGLGLSGSFQNLMTAGLWYPVAGLEDVYASTIQPRMISREVLNGPGKTNRLDSVESRASVYMVAFDLEKFDIGFALGTDHPALGWSPRPPVSIRPRGMPGPDGVGSTKPLVRLGMVSPALTNRTVATFAGGFKRQHGAFKYGDLATVNSGTHYGFIEQGAILSKLQPDLSTLFKLQDGTVAMKTWREQDNALLPQIVWARQNGVALLETDPDTRVGVPGPRVTQWGAGNWSGSAKAELRTLRAGGCIQEADGKRFLIYGYFSTATPSAMARTFQAYGCNYAMLLDMNALVHTYLALYVRVDGKVHLEHLIPGMSEVDTRSRAGQLVPRFIGVPDNRDLFYVIKREEEE
jgi:hypothetical protein